MSKPPIIVAEVSANHLGSLERALSIIEAVAVSGATHIKFQTYTADTMTLEFDGPGFRIELDHELWGGRSLYSLYQEAHTPWEWHEELFAEASHIGGQIHRFFGGLIGWHQSCLQYLLLL